jgi:myo-inositol 2-dehydrogenase/D-chiro-inositol 1-dehydrogenase
MRLGLIGVERIGAFHADTLTHLDEVDSLVVKAGVDASIPVFCEKPLSGVVAEAVAIADYVNASGATGVVSNTRYNPRGHDVRLELHGTADSVVAGWTERTPLRNLEHDTTWPSGKPWTFFMDRLVDAFSAELTAFTEVVAGQRSSPSTVDDALAVAWIAEAATLSLQQHRPVQVAEVRE